VFHMSWANFTLALAVARVKGGLRAEGSVMAGSVAAGDMLFVIGLYGCKK
jgi:hypothetical protein